MNFSDFKKILPYAVVVFFGYVGFSMPLPMLPDMFLDPEKGILPSFYSQGLKTFLLGLAMSSYPLGQLIGSPILGKCSDRWGRKKVILFSLIGVMFGYAFTAIAVSFKDVIALFGGLFFCGLCEGNVAIAQSVVADLAKPGEEGKKAAYFGWINLFICCAFILGPILGGQFSDSSLVSWFTFSTPFWMAVGMTAIAISTVMCFSEETRKQTEEGKMGFLTSFKEGFKQKDLCKMYLVNFFLALGYFSYFRFLPVYLQSAFSFNTAMQGYIIAYGSIAFAVASLLFLKRISKRMDPKKAVGVFAFLLAFSFIVVLIPSSALSIWFTSWPVNICLAVVMTYGTVLVSNASLPGFQGQAFGMLTSVQVLAEVVTGIGGGVLAGYFSFFPILIGSLMLVIASLFLLAQRTKKVDDLV